MPDVPIIGADEPTPDEPTVDTSVGAPVAGEPGTGVGAPVPDALLEAAARELHELTAENNTRTARLLQRSGLRLDQGMVAQAQVQALVDLLFPPDAHVAVQLQFARRLSLLLTQAESEATRAALLGPTP